MTAAASTWAASWRMTSSAPGLLAVMISSGASAMSGRARSRTSPFWRTASAARARPGPIAAAASAPVAPSARASSVPSGRVTFTPSLCTAPANRGRVRQGGAGTLARPMPEVRSIGDSRSQRSSCSTRPADPGDAAGEARRHPHRRGRQSGGIAGIDNRLVVGSDRARRSTDRAAADPRPAHTFNATRCRRADHAVSSCGLVDGRQASSELHGPDAARRVRRSPTASTDAVVPRAEGHRARRSSSTPTSLERAPDDLPGLATPSLPRVLAGRRAYRAQCPAFRLFAPEPNSRSVRAARVPRSSG